MPASADTRPPLPLAVTIALLEAERDHLLAKLHQLESLSQEVRRLDALSGRLESELGESRRSQAEAMRRIESQVERVGVQASERLDEALLRHLALHHQAESRVKLPWSLRWLKLRRPHGWGALRRLSKDYRLLAGSPLFDRQWYLSRNDDVAASGVDPLLHYLQSGAAEGRSPSPDFDGPAYLQAHPDVGAAGLNPLVHFLRQGARERRRTPRVRPHGST